MSNSLPSTHTSPQTTSPQHNKHHNPQSHRRNPRPLPHPPSQANEIYVSSNRSLAALQKRIKLLFFDAKVSSVIIHATGKSIFPAVRLAVDFAFAYSPWFHLQTYTTTEVAIDDIVPTGRKSAQEPILEKNSDNDCASASHDECDLMSFLPAEAFSDEEEPTQESQLQDNNPPAKRFKANDAQEDKESNTSADVCIDDTKDESSQVSLKKTSSDVEHAEHRLLGAIHIVITKTAQGKLNVK